MAGINVLEQVERFPASCSFSWSCESMAFLYMQVEFHYILEICKSGRRSVSVFSVNEGVCSPFPPALLLTG